MFIGSFAIAYESEVYVLPPSDVSAGEHESSDSAIEIKSDEWEGKNISLADLLATHSGIQTRKMGGMGAFQTVSIRGMGGNQIGLAIDGVLLQGIGATDFGSIDLSLYEKVEVYKGFIPAKFAANGMGGVVNLVSKDAAAKHGNFYASYGNHNSKTLSLQTNSLIANTVFWASNISYRASDNDYSFLSHNDTQYNTDDDFWTKRKNAEYSQVSGNHSFRFNSGKRNKALRIVHNSSDGGISGREGQESKIAGSKNESVLASYEIEPSFNNIFLDFGFMTFAGLEKNTSKCSSILDGSVCWNNYDDYEETGLLIKNGGGQGSFYLETEKVKTELYAYFNYQYLDSRNGNSILNDYELSNSLIQFALAGTLLPVNFLDIKLDAVTRFNIEKQKNGEVSVPRMSSSYKDNFRNSNSGRISVNTRNDNSAWSSSVAVGHYFRAPTLFELFSTSFGVLPNPDLKAEQGEQAELSVKYKAKKTHATMTAFANRIRDKITYYTSGLLSKPINSGSDEVIGIESEIYSELFSWMKISLNLTFQNPGKLPNEPKEQYYSSVTFSMPYSFELRLESEAHSVIYRDAAHTMKIPSAAFYHAAIAYNKDKSRLAFYVRNLNGAEYQNIYDAYPTPGMEFNVNYSQMF